MIEVLRGMPGHGMREARASVRVLVADMTLSEQRANVVVRRGAGVI